MKVKQPPIFVLKLKYLDSPTWHYFTNDVIVSPQRLDTDGLTLDNMLYYSEQVARKAMLSVIMQRREDVEAYKMVELSHYPPYPEHRVIWYKENI
jgi:hypothetical protein